MIAKIYESVNYNLIGEGNFVILPPLETTLIINDKAYKIRDYVMLEKDNVVYVIVRHISKDEYNVYECLKGKGIITEQNAFGLFTKN